MTNVTRFVLENIREVFPEYHPLNNYRNLEGSGLGIRRLNLLWQLRIKDLAERLVLIVDIEIKTYIWSTNFSCRYLV